MRTNEHRVGTTGGTADQAVAAALADAAHVHYALCRAIWNNTYLHDTLMTWHEVKPGTMHHKRVLAAVNAVLEALPLPATTGE